MAASTGHYPIEIPPLPPNAVPEDSALMARIDRQSRWPVLFYFTAGIFWLFVGAAIGMLAYFKFRHPEHLSTDIRNWVPFMDPGSLDFIPLTWVDISPLATFGRLKPAFHHVLIYGWACSAAIGLLMWVIARTCKMALPAPLALLVFGHVWHLGVLTGLINILFHGPRSREWLDMPGVAIAILLVAFIGTALPLLSMVFAKMRDNVLISTKFMLAALVWFPAVLGVTAILFGTGTLKGVLSSIVNFWYVDAVVNLWLVPVALGSVYYLLPKITGRPIGNLAYANMAFWGLAVLGGFTGLRSLYGMPVPEWLVAVSMSASVLMGIPALLALFSLGSTMQESKYLLSKNVSLRFICLALLAFVFQHTVAAVAIMFTQKYTQFTIASDAKLYLMVYTFPTLVFFGAIYYILPKILGVEWHSRRLVELHYWLTIFSTIFLTVFMFAGGAAQGAVLQEADNTIAMVVVQARAITMLGNLFWTVITISNLLFLYNLIRSILTVYNPMPFALGLVTAQGEAAVPATAEAPTSHAQA